MTEGEIYGLILVLLGLAFVANFIWAVVRYRKGNKRDGWF